MRSSRGEPFVNFSDEWMIDPSPVAKRTAIRQCESASRPSSPSLLCNDPCPWFRAGPATRLRMPINFASGLLRASWDRVPNLVYGSGRQCRIVGKVFNLNGLRMACAGSGAPVWLGCLAPLTTGNASAGVGVALRIQHGPDLRPAWKCVCSASGQAWQELSSGMTSERGVGSICLSPHPQESMRKER
jgi:hypothetical protein